MNKRRASVCAPEAAVCVSQRAHRSHEQDQRPVRLLDALELRREYPGSCVRKSLRTLARKFRADCRRGIKNHLFKYGEVVEVALAAM
jgi:hypothetical protein